MSFETKLEKYARLIVQSGLNVQEKQTVVISASIESYQLVRAVTKQAYLVGAKEVVVHYSDEEVTRMKYENMEVEDFNHVPTWFSSFRNDYALMNACFLYVDDEDPEMLAGIEPKKISNWQRAVKKACKTYFDLSDNMTNAWCIVGGATQKWANKVYPDMSNQEALDSLWNAIFKAAKIDDEHDPVELWNQHRRSFEKRVNYLNSLNLKKLYYKNSKGTEITIGLNDDYLFAGGGSYLKNGVYNFPNIPTEEIFTSPNKDDVEGIVFSSLPLSYGGNIVDEFYLRFKDGQVIDFGAKEGYEVLKGIIDSDEGSKRLGEVALIPYHSPINELKTLFYNTLYDENASCHMALGIGFSECIKGGIDMDKKELFEKRWSAKLLSALGAFPVDRQTTDMKALKTAIKLLKNGEALGIFAEGTRVKEGEAKAAKAGVALFALKGEAPIVPICISSKYKFRSVVHIRYGKPIYLDEYKGQKVTTEMMEEITEKVMEKVREMRVEV